MSLVHLQNSPHQECDEFGTLEVVENQVIAFFLEAEEAEAGVLTYEHDGVEVDHLEAANNRQVGGPQCKQHVVSHNDDAVLVVQLDRLRSRVIPAAHLIDKHVCLTGQVHLRLLQVDQQLFMPERIFRVLNYTATATRGRIDRQPVAKAAAYLPLVFRLRNEGVGPLFVVLLSSDPLIEEECDSLAASLRRLQLSELADLWHFDQWLVFVLVLILIGSRHLHVIVLQRLFVGHDLLAKGLRDPQTVGAGSFLLQLFHHLDLRLEDV